MPDLGVIAVVGLVCLGLIILLPLYVFQLSKIAAYARLVGVKEFMKRHGHQGGCSGKDESELPR